MNAERKVRSDGRVTNRGERLFSLYRAILADLFRSSFIVHRSSLLAYGLAWMLVGCTVMPVSSRTIVPPFPPPKTPGSLWQEENGRAYLYEDLRAMRVGDIITVKIVEKHKGSKNADTKAERESTVKDSLTGSTIGIPGLNLGSFMAGRALPGLSVNASAKSKFGGKGATSREDTLTGMLSAIVTEVFPNGDLRIEGTREVTVNSEKQTMILSGVVRRVDLDTRNMVLSSAIADAKIEYTGLGVVDDVQRPGWLVRILDWIYPF
ncbi:MAG: flagellar basal body L-ring protein FlgH [Nitrospirae bacterium]|nr:flagellar basal body L-ring protein FlgH [Nitrospirota bacterium]